MNGKMSNAPVFYALAQAQFNPVAAMSKYVNEIQDVLRRQGYTLFEPQEVQQLKFVAMSGQVPTQPEVTTSTNWFITKSDRTAGFILNSSSLAYHTTHYETRNEFLPEISAGLKAVHDVVNLDHLSRLGLRYLDAVLPKFGETVDQYLADGLQGVSFHGKQQYSLIESVFETETGPLSTKGTLVSRIHRASALLMYPPDLSPSPVLVPMQRFMVAEPIFHAVIDTDHFIQGSMPLDFPNIERQLASLHGSIKELFGATIATHAEKVWT